MISCEGEKSLNDFKFVTFIDRFKSDSAASIAVKGLNQCFFKRLDVKTDFLTDDFQLGLCAQ